MNKIFTALRHLTPFGKINDQGVAIEEVQRSLAFFPFVGFYIGFFLVLINVLTGRFLHDQVVNVVLVLFLLVFTGARHLKAFISMVTGTTDFSKSEIMTSNMTIKIFLVVFLALLIKYLLLNNIVPGWKNSILIVMPVIGRWALIFFPYLSLSRKKQNLKMNPAYGIIDISDFWLGTTTALFIALFLLGINGLFIFLAVSLIVIFLDWLYRKSFNGIPENLSLGMVEIAEIMTLFFFIILEYHSRNVVPNGNGILI